MGRTTPFFPQVCTGVEKVLLNFSSSASIKFQLNFELFCTPMDKCASCASTGDVSCVPPHCWEGAQAGNSCRDGPNAPGSPSCHYLLAPFLEFAFFLFCPPAGGWVFSLQNADISASKEVLWVLGPPDSSSSPGMGSWGSM